ncbi:WYL domain-containing protein [Candidatus Poribacteria bacterium]|nr:WYL domain-containing protein [Gammaproteobacteria bacterium]MYF99193.1 WYL domain-containing protein [Candidatus Poribacteria bacterium]
MDEAGEQLRWGVRRRLEFIDFRLFWDGRFNRKDMAETFGISAQQASVDIGQYEKIAPDNLAYDPAEKAYRRSEKYEPAFIGGNIDQHLLQLIAIENQWIRQEDSWFRSALPIEVVTLGGRPTDPAVLLRVLQAIRNRLEVVIEYASLTGSPQPSRIIAPHALAYSDERWYIRSWSRDHNDFRDYKLSRISAVADSRPSSIDPSLDFEWAHEINLVIVPNPALPPERQTAISAELGMTDKRLVHSCRLSLSFYLMSKYNLEIEPGVLDPNKQQVVLQNRDQVIQARAAARQLSKEALARTQGSDKTTSGP